MGLFKLLLTGEDDEFNVEPLAQTESTSSDESAYGKDSTFSDDWAARDELEQNPFAQAAKSALEREVADARHRDELLARVGRLHLAVESLLRLMIDKGVITDLDVRRMQQRVDLEDGRADGEYCGDLPPVPDYCPKCEAKITPGKRMCVMCGQRFDPQ
jgi:hypothetical protein